MGTTTVPSEAWDLLAKVQPVSANTGLGLISFFVLYICWFFQLPPFSRGKLPPGPRPLPVIGNVHQLPRTQWWHTLREWHAKYGPIISFKMGQRTVISVGSNEVAHELLHRQGKKYSSRPRMIIIGEYFTKGLHMLTMPYSKKWQLHRRLIGELMASRHTTAYRRLQDFESKQTLYDMLRTDDFSPHYVRYACSLIFTLAYAKRVEVPHQPEIEDVAELLHMLTSLTNRPVEMLGEAFPCLNVLPRFLAPWKRYGEIYHTRALALFTQNIKDGHASPAWNFCKHLAQSKETKELTSNDIAYLLGLLYEAGVETTASTLDTFTLATVINPDRARLAQQELDAVVGKDRLPSFSDMPNLPYVNAYINEVLRWRPLVPIGFPHAPTQDEEFMGYRIPAEAMILPNHWTLEFEEGTFADPFEFQPERWIKSPNLPSSAFGYGRRLCPGKAMGEASLFIVIARMLWGFNISHAYENGEKIEVDPWNMKETLTSPPAPFKAAFTVRSAEHQRVIESEWLSTEKDVTVILGEIEAAIAN